MIDVAGCGLRERAATVLLAAWFAAVPATSTAAPPASALPDTAAMNILIVMGEDLNCTAVGCYGNRPAITPNIDEFAEQSLRFTHAFCQSAVCNPSRTSLLTGLRSPTTGVWGNRDKYQEHVPNWAVSIPEHLQAYPVETVAIGKLFHHNYHAVKASNTIDVMGQVTEDESYPGRVATYQFPPGTPPKPERVWTCHPDPDLDKTLRENAARAQAEMARHPKYSEAWKKAWDLYRAPLSKRIGDSGEPPQRSSDKVKAGLVRQLLCEYKENGKQFLMTVGFTRPHTPMLCPRQYLDLYDRAKLQLTAATVDKDVNVPKVARRKDQDHVTFRFYGDEQSALVAYLACTTLIDDAFGDILQGLRETGLSQNTIVVFTSDHGFMLGEHGLWCKNVLFDQAVRVPFIVHVPGAPANGATTDAIVKLVDLFPTICDLLQIPFPHDRLEGTSMVPLLDTPNRPWKKAAFTVNRLGKTVLGSSARVPGWSYTEWWNPQTGELRDVELYDLTTDPFEQRNLADKHHPSVHQDRMARILAQGWQGAVPVAE